MLPVIRVKNLSKKHRLGVINRQMLVDRIESWVAHKLGRPYRKGFGFDVGFKLGLVS